MIRNAIRTKHAVAFDLGGVLADTEKHHFAAHRRALREAGVDLTLKQYLVHGVSTDPVEFYIRVLGQHTNASEIQKLLACKAEYYARLLATRGFTPILPAIKLVRQLQERGMLLALVTAETKRDAESLLHVSLFLIASQRG